jgi:hypothetical protein
MSLYEIDYSAGGMRYPDRRRRGEKRPLAEYLDLARVALAAARERPREPLADPVTTRDFEELRWFPYPGEAIRA